MDNYLLNMCTHRWIVWGHTRAPLTVLVSCAFCEERGFATTNIMYDLLHIQEHAPNSFILTPGISVSTYTS